MKNKLTIGAALLLAGILSAIPPGVVQSQGLTTKSPVQVVHLEYYDVETSTNGVEYHGTVVFNSSSSEGAPIFPNYPNPGVQQAEAEAQLLTAGFEMVPGVPGMFVKKSKAGPIRLQPD